MKEKIAPLEKDKMIDMLINPHETADNRLYGLDDVNHDTAAKGMKASMMLAQSLENIPIGRYKYRNWAISSKPISMTFARKKAKKKRVSNTNTPPIAVSAPHINCF